MPPKKKGGNQRRKEEIAHNRLEYLWQISLSYATTMPSISRFYVSIMWEVRYEKRTLFLMGMR
jgi:RNase P subunit RPR2